MKIAVTGGSGFIASHVIENLLGKGYEVMVFDHSRSNSYPRGVEVFLGDIRDATAVRELAAHSDGLIHLAGILGTQENVLNPRPATETNIMGGLNVLEAVAEFKIPMVNIAVGNWFMDNPYSLTKHTIERFINMYNKERDTKINVVRAVNCYGSRQSIASPFGSSKVRKMIPYFICSALSRRPIEVYGDGKQVSDCIYVPDVAEALVRALEEAAKGKVLPRAVEIGPSENMTVMEVANLVNEIVGRSGYEWVDIKKLPMRPGETVGVDVKADVSTLELIGMNPSELIPLSVGLRETIEWYIENEGVAWKKPHVD